MRCGSASYASRPTPRLSACETAPANSLRPMRAVFIESFAPDDPASVIQVGDRPEPETPPGWVVVDVRATTLNHHDVWSARGVGLTEKQLPMILGCDAAGVDPGRQRGRRARRRQRPHVGRAGGARPADAAALRGAAGRAGRAARRPRGEPRAQAGRAELRGGGVPADGLAHGLPDAVHARRARPGRDGARPGRLGRPLPGADHARRRRRPARLGHRPRRGEARVRGGARRARDVRAGRAAAGARRRGHGLRRRADVQALARLAAPRRRARQLRARPAAAPARSSSGGSSASTCASPAPRWARARSSRS